MSRLRPSGHGGQARVGCRVSHHWGQPLIFDRPALSAGPTLGRDENSRLGADDDDDFAGRGVGDPLSTICPGRSGQDQA